MTSKFDVIIFKKGDRVRIKESAKREYPPRWSKHTYTTLYDTGKDDEYTYVKEDKTFFYTKNLELVKNKSRNIVDILNDSNK